MKRFLHALLTVLMIYFLCPARVSGQKIYSVDRAYQADVKVYVVDKEYKADLVV